jgi:hypothetical protein
MSIVYKAAKLQAGTAEVQVAGRLYNTSNQINCCASECICLVLTTRIIAAFKLAQRLVRMASRFRAGTTSDHHCASLNSAMVAIAQASPT